MSENYYAVIMAGGGGTRLWPLSREARPKQMLTLVGERTLFQVAVDRLKDLFPPEKILVVTAASQAPILQTQSPELPSENFVLEPKPRGTAAAIGLTSVVLLKRDPQAIMAVLTADHFIENEKKFLHILKAARVAAEQDLLVTLGIQPTHPATGFGYIQQGNYLDTYEGMDAFRATRFVEKPDIETANQYLTGEEHSWNSGMFIWRVEVVMKEFERQMPTLYNALKKISDSWGTPKQDKVLNKVWPGLYKESIDYGIMENAKKVAVIPARGLGWTDVGSWNAMYNILPMDTDGNIIKCENHINVDSKNTMVFANGDNDRLFVTVGVENLVIVDTGDVLLVCSKEQAQDVRLVVKLLKEKGQEKFL
jgi:mannose-1-phosphate guanylyltransferase